MALGSGATLYTNTALAATATLVFTGRCGLCWYHLFNTTTAEAYVMFYDAAAAADVTVGTTVPTLCLAIHAESGAGLGATVASSIPFPIRFNKGLVVASVTAITGNTGSITAVGLGITT